MIVESLARLGCMVRAARLDAREVIADLTDVSTERAGGFFHQVVLVEVESESGALAVHPSMRWAEPVVNPRGRRIGFRPAQPSLGCLAPFSIPVGGVARMPQGSYPVPAYIVYGARGSGAGRRPGQLEQMVASADEVERFLGGRLPRTVAGLPPQALWPALYAKLHAELAAARAADEDDALLVLVVSAPGSPYGRLRLAAPAAPGSEAAPGVVVLAASRLEAGAALVAHLDRLQDAVLRAKAREAVETGGAVEDGRCAVCTRAGRCVSIYSKNWSWYAPTWEAPRPQELPVDRLAEGVAVCGTVTGTCWPGPMPSRPSSSPSRAG